MKKLSKAQVGEHQTVAKTLHEKWSEYQEALSELNGAIQDARELRDEVTGEMEGYYDERSDKWRQSEAGDQYGEWKSAWDEIALDDVEEPELDPQAFEDLPDEPGYE